ncbi:phage tail tape measure protein [Endozoicomonas ascidiicola]|uniref:phage tail tape measure protein n=1 Tax=Endozoicomonas ascidiicola TaxID=1698521 RepID=UPI00082D7F87|nr:phage tail tape measure protein [Endozoicomonas ascidiicola]
MNDALRPLMFTVGLIDRISGPAGRATRSFDGLINTAKGGFEDMRSGAMGLAATGFLIYESLTPAIEMNRALAEVQSIGVQENALKQLNDTALELSASYGLVAAEVVGSGAQISKAIKGLSGDELSAFTSAAGVLATTTKAGMEETSLYITQMYERFKGTADAMGKSQWVENLVGQTSYLAKEMGTNTTDIADAMQGINNLGTGLGVSMEEQLAVLATLGKSTGIADAEAQYTNFLEYAVAAQDKLGMSFTDSNGKLLPMLDIIGQLQGEFGDLSGADTWAVLDDAFGDGSKLIQQLSKDTVGLGKTINDLGNINGMTAAADAAEAMTDPWQQLTSAVNAVRIAMGQALLPAIEPVIQCFADMGQDVLLLIKLFPNITKIIGMTALVILALASGMALLTIAVGIGKAAWAGWILTMQVLRGVTVAFTAVQWLLNAAFVASPIGLIVIGIMALGAALFMAWQGVKLLWDIFKESSAGQFLMATLGGIVNWFKSLGGIVDWVIDKLNMIPGVNIGGESADMATDLSYRNEGVTSEVPAGGVTSQISKSIADNSSSSTTVNIQTTEPVSPQYVQDQIWQAAP